MQETIRIAIVGAASLAGKELAEAIAESPFATAEVLLMDEAEGLGQIEPIGDEVTVIGAIEEDSFDRVDYVFFTGTPQQTLAHWKAASAAHASIIDMTGALEAEPGVLVMSPWVRDMIDNPVGPTPDLKTPALVPAHIAATAVSLLMARLVDAAPVRCAWATIFEPASQHGRAAVDELHQQTVALLNFQSMPKDVFDAQATFNLSPTLGELAKYDIYAIETTIRQQCALLSGGRISVPGVQLVQAPTFHGYCLSLGIELEQAVTLDHIEAALSGDHLDVVLSENDPPNNLSTAGQDDILLRIRSASTGSEPSTRYWIWAAFDNLKLASLHAISCAGELGKLRPQGIVQ
jgi:aspartate-semialdehyde dehydrogenase